MMTNKVDFSVIELGKYYKLPHGTGVYVGYESFDEHGMNAELIKENPTNQTQRKAFKLEEGHTWGFDNELYYAFPHDIMELD